ncbi:MAG: alkaline phosphatase family protein [Candidatus Thorarchaeota archaeon]
MSSIISAVGLESPYQPLQLDSSLNLEDSDNVILMIVDGLGYNYLKDFKLDTLLAKSIKSSMSSVFLPSTGSAISTFFTGYAPQQHTVTGWYVYLKEYGLVSRFLPFSSAIDWNVLGTDISNSVGVVPILPNMERDHYVILGNEIIDSVYTRYMSGNANRLGYTNLSELFSQIRVAVTSSEKSYIHAYWPQLDAIAHMLGMYSPEAKDHLHTFDKALQIFLEDLEGTNTSLIITSDHGFNDVAADNSIFTREHPKLMESLRLPLCGDTRSAYCYVRPSKTRDFEKYISDNLEDICDIHQSQSLIDDQWFGIHEPNPRLLERVGDYVLTFKAGYAIVNCFPGLEPAMMLGHHGGITSDEMLVPLIVIDC